MARKKIAAANWKMNTTHSEGVALLAELITKDLASDVEVVINAPATHLFSLSALDLPANVHIGAQNMYPKVNGAFTGELSPAMLKAVGATHVIIGHSERRQYFHESNEFLADKLRVAIEHGLRPIFCCGEGLEIRQSGRHVAYVISQLRESLSEFSATDLETLVIAYEPIWAIGTGETASPEQAQEMQAEIRSYLASQYGDSMADHTPILYGGSVKPANAEDIFGQKDVDGGLVGGASLKADSFAEIVNAFS
ncbi:MAG: triose-phosphate isomerase [Bacteroidota bacterium]